jgi:serine/threonine-protein kinase
MSASVSRVPVDSQEETRDLQDRIGRFTRMAFGISGVMLVAALASDYSLNLGWGGISKPSRVVHVTAQVVLLVVWKVCRGKALPESVLRAIDAVLTVVLCTAWALLGLGAPGSEPIEMTVILATTYTLIMRSVMVPSAFYRTVSVSGVAVAPTIAFFYIRDVPFLPEGARASSDQFLIFATLWCIVAVITAGLHSRQLYGLRQRIREVGKLGQYTLEEKIGEGGMGVVYRATHAMLRRPAAIKLLLPDRAGAADLARFEREVQLTSQLTHPNTISIFDYGRSSDGTFYYVMEYLDGFDLERLIDSEGPLEPARAIRILAQASGALAEAHALGLIHRDIKPANIILTERVDEPDVVKVVDFGLVKTIDSSPGDLAVTKIDSITGTPMYLAPEAIATPDAVDARSDLYALGAVGYFLITGKHVFDASSVVEMCSKHLLEVPVAPSLRLGRPVPADLEAILLACLAKPPEARPDSAEALRAALLACADAERYDVITARAWWRSRGATLRARPTVPPSVDRGATMAIDLRGRATLTSSA